MRRDGLGVHCEDGGALIAESQGRPTPLVWAVPDRGYLSSAANASDDSKRVAQELIEKPELAAAMVATRMDPNNGQQFRGGFNYDAFQRQDNLLRSAGITPIYITVPYLYLKSPDFDTVNTLAQAYTVIDFDNPAAYPQLFEPNMYFDLGHFNESGAVLFTRLVARTIVSLAQEGRLPPLPASSATPAPAKTPAHGPR